MLTLRAFAFVKRQISFALAMGLLLCSGSPSVAFESVFSETTEGPSLLNPSTAIKTRFTYPVDAVDPTPQSNPTGAIFPGHRGPDQLILYTPTYGQRTQTNTAGVEAVVINGVVESIEGNNQPIPENGFVISGHGKAAQWMRNLVKPGAKAQIQQEDTPPQLVIEHTPQVYQRELEALLNRALKASQSEENKNEERAENFQITYEDAAFCLEKLPEKATSGKVTSEFIAVYDACKEQASYAYYHALPTFQGTFRGIWVRPYDRTETQIRQTIANLKKLKIKHIFLETYFQGRTLYPSQVMKEYGLPEQHAQFQGRDLLKTWIEEAHANDMQVHAWVQTFFAGSSKENIEPFGPILQQKPEWRNVQRTAVNYPKPVPSSIEEGHYFLDPANPEVQVFLEKLLLEIVNQYEIDGLNLDYIRYPASASPSSGRYLETNWGYSTGAREGFVNYLEQERLEQAKKLAAEKAKKEGRSVPETVNINPLPKAVLEKQDPIHLKPGHSLWPQWVQWRKDQVSKLVEQVSLKARSSKPNLLITAVVFPPSEGQEKLQDIARWTREGWVQALTPIGLYPTPEGIYKDSLALKQLTHSQTPIYVGLFGMYNRYEPVDFLSQVDAARKADMEGIVLFEKSRLTDEYLDALLKGPFR